MRDERLMTYAGGILLLVLAGVTVFVWSAVFATAPTGNLSVTFLDVGQGDAVFIESPTGVQVLVDAGEGRAVFRALTEVMPWFDRSLDMLIATHPDSDHIGAFPTLLERYEVQRVVRSGVVDDGGGYHAFNEAIQTEGARVHTARRGQRYMLGGGSYIEILFPDRDVSGVAANTGSIVARLVYGDTAFLLTGDAPRSVEEYLTALDTDSLESDVLKVSHHGSRTSSSPLFVGYVDAEMSVLSYGCDNSYGHPHEEVLETLNRFAEDVIHTCTNGSIMFSSDGYTVMRE